MLLTDIAQLKPARPGQSGGRTVIVGSGAVGLYAACELLKRGRDVVVVESGGTQLGNFDPESLRLVGLPNEQVKMGRSRTLGGTTNLWGGQLVEFMPVDINGRDWMPDSKWPVTYDEIARYYKETYKNLGYEGATLDDDAVWKSVGSGRADMGQDLETFLTRWLKQPNFAVYFDKQVRTSESLQLLTEHTVVGFRGDGGTITAVQVRDSKGGLHLIQGDTFIMGTGTVETSRLLLTAAADESWACPWRGNDNVGAFFQDHFGGHLGVLQPTNTKTFFKAFCSIAKGGHKYTPRIRLRNEVLERERLLNIYAMVAFESSATEHMVYLKQFLKAALYSRRITGLGSLIKNARSTVKYLVPLMWSYVWEHRIFVPSTSKVTLRMQGEQFPVRESRITIDPSYKDANGLPRVVVDWRMSGEEQAQIREFTLRVGKAFEQCGLATLKIDDDLLAMNPKYMTTLRATTHQSGGACMGTSPADGVVDKNLKVFGTSNLYLGGACTFRTVSCANITFTAVTLMTRLVHHLCDGRPDAADTVRQAAGTHS